MEIVEQELATVEHADAYHGDDLLIVRLTGRKPTACHIVSLERGLPDVEPPAFTAGMRIDPRVRCMQQVADFEVVQAFRMGAAPPEVLIHHAGGQLTVPVEELAVDSRTAAAPLGALPGGFVDDTPVEASGYSRSYDLAEAVRDAIAKLPDRGPGIPDWLNSYTVVSIGVELGGIGGFDHLKVTVRG